MLFQCNECDRKKCPTKIQDQMANVSCKYHMTPAPLESKIVHRVIAKSLDEAKSLLTFRNSLTHKRY